MHHDSIGMKCKKGTKQTTKHTMMKIEENTKQII